LGHEERTKVGERRIWAAKRINGGGGVACANLTRVASAPRLGPLGGAGPQAPEVNDSLPHGNAKPVKIVGLDFHGENTANNMQHMNESEKPFAYATCYADWCTDGHDCRFFIAYRPAMRFSALSVFCE